MTRIPTADEILFFRRSTTDYISLQVTPNLTTIMVLKQIQQNYLETMGVCQQSNYIIIVGVESTIQYNFLC